jgi:hypothetical protein
MREDTSAWLEPMMKAADARFPSGWMLDLSAQVEGARQQAIDWVRFGYVLRHRLGWDGWYPDHPSEPDTGASTSRITPGAGVQPGEYLF